MKPEICLWDREEIGNMREERGNMRDAELWQYEISKLAFTFCLHIYAIASICKQTKVKTKVKVSENFSYFLSAIYAFHLCFIYTLLFI